MAFHITILGCGAATPTLSRFPSAQVVQSEQYTFLVDCGEGTQMQLIRFGISMNKIDAIFISHLHGDHYLGLPGLISSMHLAGRKERLKLFGPESLQEIIMHQFRLTDMHPQFPLEFYSSSEVPMSLLYENDKLEVLSFPLVHRIFCTGFLFREKVKPRIINPKAVKALNIPNEKIKAIKYGDDYSDDYGKIHKHTDLTFPPKPSHSYAYCSDTAYFKELPEWIKGVNLLYHEATFAEEKAERATETFHSTAKHAAMQAQHAKVGKLIIGHFSSRYKSLDQHLSEAKDIFIETTGAFDGLKISTDDF